MTQTNLYMEDDNLRLYIDVQPLFLDELENSKNLAVASAARAAQSEEAARGWKNDIEDYKTGLELFYAQATDGIENLYNSSVSDIGNEKTSAISDLQRQKTNIQNSLNATYNNALNNIRTNGQAYVDMAHNYAEEAKHTVDNRVSKDHLNQSKGLETGSVSDDEEVLSDIKKYAHSTFDLSKFAVVGSPTITNDGIASWFSDSAYLTQNLSISNATDFELISPVFYNILSSNRETVIMTPNTGTLTHLALWSYANDPYVTMIINQDDNGTRRELVRIGFAMTSGVGYQVKWVLKNGLWDIYYRTTENLEWVRRTTTSVTAIDTVTINNLYIGKDYYTLNAYCRGSIDLKQFSITVDGVEVFSGNKTGIDTIKPDNYTVVGTPTISADGIASGFSSSKHLDYIVNWNNPNSSYKELYKIRVNKRNAAVVQRVNGCLNYAGTYLSLWDDKLCFAFTTYAKQGSSWEKEWYGVGNQLELGTWYYVKFEWDGVKYTFSYKSENDNDYIILGTYNSAEPIYQGLTYLLGIGSNSAQPFTGSIDLNSFKIYVDGNLVYQPCLKIPYTESSGKYGSKIVSAIYRDRVKDAYEQGYQQRYYTLDEENGNFTLPMGDIYGMIESLRQLINQMAS